MENPAPPAISRHSELWLPAAAFGDAVRGATGGPGASGRGMAISQRAHAAAPSGVGANGSLASFAIRHGGCAESKGAFRRGVDSFCISGQAIAPCVGGSENGRHPPAAIGSGRTGKLCRHAVGTSACKPQLHAFRSITGLLHRPVRDHEGDHFESVSRKSRNSRFRARRYSLRRWLARRGRGKTAVPGRQRAVRLPLFEKLAAVFMAWLLPVGILEHALGRESKICFGRFGRSDFFQREHGRSERRDVEPLQYRIEHRTGRSDIQIQPA